jgi:membrane-associated phospholipid phosphatase
VRSRLLIPLFVLAAAFSATSVSHADVVTQWNSAALAAIRANKTSPPRASRALAILHASIYDAINGITRSHESYFVPSDVPPNASIDAAGSAAAHVVLVSLFPAESTSFDDLHAAIMAAIPVSPRRRIGLEWGERVALQILAWRAGDGGDAGVPVSPADGPGVWQPTPPAFAAYLLPQWAFVWPFGMPSSSFLRPPGPPSLDSPEWVADFDEVKALGASVGSTRTPEQSLIALFWADGAGTETPPGHWNSLAQRVSASQRTSLEATARLFALLNIAMADAAICAWDAKYAYNFWRPVTAIRNGEADGNPATVADPEWTSFIVTPPFPDYVSGHSTFSGAAAAVLAGFYGTDNISFTLGSDGLPGVTRAFSSFTAAAKEAAVSRLYGGIHFRTANEDGLSAGIAIGEWTVAHHLQPKGNRSRK